MTTSRSTVPGASDDAQSNESNGPLSLDALFSAELSGGQPADPADPADTDSDDSDDHADQTVQIGRASCRERV